MSRIRALFTRYVERHFKLVRPGMVLPGPPGHLDQITHADGCVVLDGWTDADSISASHSNGRDAMVPNLRRDDVAAAIGVSGRVGFRLKLPATVDAITIEIRSDEETWRVEVPGPSARQLRTAKKQLRRHFIRDLLRAAPHLIRAWMTGNGSARARAKACLGFGQPTGRGSVLENRLFDREGLPEDPAPVPITIVLPVYNAFDLLKEALARVIENTDLPWHLVLIEDASPDPRVRFHLREWAEWNAARVTLLENPENLGFIGSVNRGLACALERGDHVVLLNSDALVPPGWASRLVRPLLCHEDVASVTPMSNDATIMTAPVICAPHDLTPGVGDAVDAVARRFNPEALLTLVPTGVGFCMAMNIDYLRKLPQLDPGFGRGYGEEVDWCQRARALGGRHLALPGLFVEHAGGESFGSATKQKLISRNNAIIRARYPDYDGEVQRFIADDPLATARLALGLACAAAKATSPIRIYIAHVMGGGAETYLQGKLQSDLSAGRDTVVLRVGGPRRWRVELHGPQGTTSGDTDDFDFVCQLLEPIRARRVIYSCAVGDPDPIALPDMILRLVRDGTPDRLSVLFHDYFPLSPSYTLLDSDMVYRGPVTSNRSDRAHITVRPDGTVVTLAAWRQAWGRLLTAARDLVTFSQDSRAQVLFAYSGLQGRIVLRPHVLEPCPARVARPQGDAEVIGVLGNIGAQKGAAVVSRLSLRFSTREDRRLVIVGTVDPAYPLAAGTIVTGPYRQDQISRIAVERGITRWLIPSIWPETYSFTTHEALATGLPVHAFDIGAQGAAVRVAPNGVPIKFDASADLALLFLQTVAVGDVPRVA